MIGRRELGRLAGAAGVTEVAQEKDYVLSWLLSARVKCGLPALVFKGGTALRKCYFENYRYSEDLDFTLTSGTELAELPDLLRTWFTFVKEESGISTFFQAEAKIDSDSFLCYVNYTAVLGGTRSLKIDVGSSDRIHDRVVSRRLISAYSDLQQDQEIETYSLVEIFAEKVRSLVQRTEPRDVYDLVELMAVESELPADALSTYEAKLKDKGLDKNQLSRRLKEAEPTFRGMWSTRLASHVANLPEFDGFWRALRRGLRAGGYVADAT